MRILEGQSVVSMPRHIWGVYRRITGGRILGRSFGCKGSNVCWSLMVGPSSLLSSLAIFGMETFRPTSKRMNLLSMINAPSGTIIGASRYS
jgi:hypothetical protein